MERQATEQESDESAETARTSGSGTSSEPRPLDVCVITQLHPSMNPRVVKEADALTAAGYSVGVIAPQFSQWGKLADEEFSTRDWQIVRRPRFGPLSPWHIRIPELARRGIAEFATRTLGLTSPAALRAAWHPVAPGLFAAARKHKAKLYIAHMVSALPAAAAAATHYNTRYAFDAEDFHAGEMPNLPQFAHLNALSDRIIRTDIYGCSYVTAASPLMAEAYAERYQIPKPIVVLNVFPKSQAPKCVTYCGTTRPNPSIYWFSQTIGPGRGIECAVDAIGLCKSVPHLFLRGQVAQGFLERIYELADRSKVRSRVHILAPENPSEMERLASAFDVGLSGEPSCTPNNAIALGNKIFTYLLAGIPILMSDSPAHRHLAIEIGDACRLFETGNAVDLAARIDDLLGSSESLARARYSAWQLGQARFNWEVEQKHLITAVRSILG